MSSSLPLALPFFFGTDSRRLHGGMTTAFVSGPLVLGALGVICSIAEVIAVETACPIMAIVCDLLVSLKLVDHVFQRSGGRPQLC